jgi:hypothetical protein
MISQSGRGEVETLALNRCGVVLFGLTMAFLGWTTVATAQRVTGRVLTGTQLFEKEGCTFVRVQFSMPVRYTSHFPVEAGDELRIRVAPTALNPDDEVALLSREAVRPPFDVDVPIINISYEGDLLNAPALVVEFRRPLSYFVGQGTDFRSILIGIPGPERASPCI